MTSTPARTRIAPSPTGEYHIGHLRTCLYDYALAKKTGGQFIVRIEDTDQKRYVVGAVDRILKVIKDYGLSWDEGPYVQTDRLDIYQKYIQELLDKGHAYYCFCTEERLTEIRDIQKAAKKIPKYDRHCLSLSKEEIDQKIKEGVPYVVRLRLPDHQDVIFDDIIRGKIKFNTDDLDDQVLIKSNGIPTYHFAVVVDDHLMNITHIFRGEEWISSTPKQILLYQFFGWDVPQFAHLTVLLDPGGQKKMSKRNGSVSAQSFLDEGYLPEAMLNFLMLLGWNPGTEQELFTLDEFVKAFSLDHLHKKSPVFDRKKLDYFNGLYIRQKTNDELRPYFQKFLPQASPEQIEVLIPVLKERLVKFSDLKEQVKFLFEDVIYDKELLLKKGTSVEVARDMLEKSIKMLLSDFQTLDFKTLISENSWNTGEFFMVFRVAICGVAFTPPVVECLPALGQENTIRKLRFALSLLE
jgi:nondiscriminating glutamyl-tRNA synthetase